MGFDNFTDEQYKQYSELIDLHRKHITPEILPLFQTTKQERKDFVEDIVELVENDESKALDVLLQVKNMEDIINSLLNTNNKTNKNSNLANRFKEVVLKAASRYPGGKNFELNNAKFEVKEVGVSYDFSKCNDPALWELQAKFDEAKRQLDARKEFLKTIPLSGQLVGDDATGQMWKAYPPVKSSTTSVTVTLK